MQTDLFRIWTWVAVSISYDSIQYTLEASTYVCMCASVYMKVTE